MSGKEPESRAGRTSPMTDVERTTDSQEQSRRRSTLGPKPTCRLGAGPRSPDAVRGFAAVFATAIFAGLVLVLSAIVLPSSDARAEEEADAAVWAASSIQGGVWARAANDDIGVWRRLTGLPILEVGAQIRTDVDGSTTLISGFDSIDMGPNTLLILPGAPREADEGSDPVRSVSVNADQPTTGVTQISGSATYSIEPNRDRRFFVRTPYMVTLVKGTVFAIDIARDRASVVVDEGEVQVFRDWGTTTFDVNQGYLATIPAAPRGTISVRATQAAGDGGAVELPAGVTPRDAENGTTPGFERSSPRREHGTRTASSDGQSDRTLGVPDLPGRWEMGFNVVFLAVTAATAWHGLRFRGSDGKIDFLRLFLGILGAAMFILVLMTGVLGI